jgi:hypothetical protein
LLKELALKGLFPAKVGRNDWLDCAVSPCTVTLIGPYVAPAGTVTVRLEALALVTAACTPPKWTMFPAAFPEKLLPVIDMALASAPAAGLRFEITGTAQNPMGTKARDTKTDRHRPDHPIFFMLPFNRVTPKLIFLSAGVCSRVNSSSQLYKCTKCL